MKKRKEVVVILLIGIFLLLSISFVSAGFVDWFTDLFNIGDEDSNFEGELASLSPTSENQDLIAYYSFEGNADDVSGNGNNGINHGADFVDGKIGQAGSFDGSDYVSIDDLDNDFNIKGLISFGSWIKLNGDGNYHVISRRDEISRCSEGYVLSIDNGYPKLVIDGVGCGNTKIKKSDTALELNEWHHVIGVFEGSQLKIYINGKLDSSLSVNELGGVSGRSLIIGASLYKSSYTNHFKGSIDEVKIWNKALSADEVREEYECGEECFEDWSCTSWSDCINEEQTRTCTDDNNCGTKNNKPEEIRACCIPDTCSSLGYGCGNWSDGCGGAIDCGICDLGESCVNGACINSCIPDTCSGLGYGCGNWSDGCGGAIDCGICDLGESCQQGTCIIQSDENLIAHYSFEGNTNDVSGNENNGVNNGASFEEGKIGQALSFDGNDYVSIDDLDNDFNIKGLISFGSWIKLNGDGNYHVISRRDEISRCSEGYVLSIDNGYPKLVIDGVGCRNTKIKKSDTALELDQWYHVIGVFDGSQLKIYINGNLDSSLSVNELGGVSGRSLIIGASLYKESYTNHFKGSIDEVKIWNRALNAEEVREEYEREEIRELNFSLSIATLKNDYQVGEQIMLTDPPDVAEDIGVRSGLSAVGERVISDIHQNSERLFTQEYVSNNYRNIMDNNYETGAIRDYQRDVLSRSTDQQETPKFNGYIVQFKDKPILEEKDKLDRKAEKTEEFIEEYPVLSTVTGYKFFVTTPDEVPGKVEKYSKKLEKNNEGVKERILDRIKEKRSRITGKAVSDLNSEIEIMNEFDTVFNGIALDISKKEADEIKEVRGIKDVYPNYEVYTTLMDSVPLINADDAWRLDEESNDCLESGKECLTGEGVRIAIIDTGVDYTHEDLGGCFGEGCKVVGGYDFVNNDDYPMDDQGHGTHVAATAAGKSLDKDADGTFCEFNEGEICGIAPDAKIYAYKVLNSRGSGWSDDIIAAIDRTVDLNENGAPCEDESDYVDIISLSLGGYGNPDDPMSLAIDNAALCTVPVISAGNSGPSPQTIGSPGTARKAITVGANYNKDDIGTDSELIVILDNNKIVESSTLAITTSETGLIGEVVSAGYGYQEDFESLDVSGKIVLLKNGFDKGRSYIYITEKMVNAQNAGASGIIIYNTNENLLKGARDLQIPAISIGKTDGEYLLDLISNNYTEVKIIVRNDPDNVIYFSSRGIVTWLDEEDNLKTLVKPDITAPGVSICAAQCYQDRLWFDYFNKYGLDVHCLDTTHITISGTSMSAPHVSGVVALLKQAHPDWRPQEIKMALRNTAIDIGEDVNTQGYGRVDPLDLLKLKGKPAIAKIETSGIVNDTIIDIVGTASGDNFSRYTLYYGIGENPSEWIEISTSNQPIENGILYEGFDISLLSDGMNRLKLAAVNSFGEISEDMNVFFKLKSGIKRITTDDSPQWFPLIYEDKIFWWTHGFIDDIYMYDLSTEEKIRINQDNFMLEPFFLTMDVSESKIVWSGFKSKTHIDMYDLITQEESKIIDGSSFYPSVYGDKMVYSDYKNRKNLDIYMYDLTTGIETQITTDDSDQYLPDIYEDKIVWHDWRNGNSDIYMYDLTTGVETQITTDSKGQYQPGIYGDKIVWHDWRDFYSHIYVYDLTTGIETQITTDDSDHYSPDIYEDKIVWRDWRNGYSNSDIYMYDLSTGVETQITVDSSYQMDPGIYGDKIVWPDWRNGNYDVYMYDLSTGVETQISTDEYYQNYPAIYEDKIIWQEEEIPWQSKAYMYDLSTNKETRITTTDYNYSEFYPAIYENKIVWQDSRNENYDIYMYDLTTGIETQITTDDSHHYSPDIYEDKIVWLDWRNGNSDIYMYDLTTGVETQITTDESNQFIPYIYEDKIVWDDYRNGNADTYMYDLSTGEERRITVNPLYQVFPTIYRDKIVWEDYRNGNADIYMYDPRPQSKIVNKENEDITGQMILKLQKNVDGEWIDEQEVVNQQITIPSQGLIKLDIGQDNNGNQVFEGFNNLDVSVSKAGDYRVYVSFEVDGQIIETNWEFKVE